MPPIPPGWKPRRYVSQDGRRYIFRQALSEHLKAAGISKKDSRGRVVDFHSFRHTFCTCLHRAGVPMREAMELMRHSEARLTMKIYTDTALFALRPAVEKLPWSYSENDAQIDAQTSGAGSLLPSLWKAPLSLVHSL